MTQPEIAWACPGERLLSDEEVSRAVREALRVGGRAGAPLSVVFVEDDELAALHADHLGDPSRTDVITFDLGGGEPGPVGELYVSVDRARRVAGRRGVSVRRELCLYVVHGVLHLCGFDDGTDEERVRMRAAEATVLAGLGYESDERAHDDGAD